MVDIQTFEYSKRVVNTVYVAAFTLFSNIFSGNYFVFTLKNKRKTEKTLIKLIQNYCQHNGIKNIILGSTIKSCDWH